MGDFVELLGSGRQHGCHLTYRVQDEAGGIAQALGLAELYCQGVRTLVILGDNIFLDDLKGLIAESSKRPDHAWITLKRVPDPGRYGVAEIEDHRIKSIEEKPAKPRSDYAVAGIYIYPPDVFGVIKTLKPSARGELEITDVNRYYLGNNRLGFSMIDGYWTDAGTLESLAYANQLVFENPHINGLQQPRPESYVDVKARIKHDLGNIVFGQRNSPFVLLCGLAPLRELITEIRLAQSR